MARVLVLEAETFPRDHIGESMAHPLVPILEQSGALKAVLDSDCYVRKYGGVFQWDPAKVPFVSMFEHAHWERDQVLRWSIHVNRAEFDEILLENARNTGAHIVCDAEVNSASRSGDHWVVGLSSGAEFQAGILIDASGRNSRIYEHQSPKAWLSDYKNIAVWTHLLGCAPVQSIKEPWNVFQQLDISAIGCFAFHSGWVWYIPTPATVAGRREIVHSVGIVTNNDYIKSNDITDFDNFFRVLKGIPYLGELISASTPIRPNMLTTANYSRIADRFCSFEDRWISVGDASYFVDPLFSSGVSFAVTQAAAAAILAVEALSGNDDAPDLWYDYDRGWHAMAETFSLAIDQWYHEIGLRFPEGSYWSERALSHSQTPLTTPAFRALLDTALVPDLLNVMTHGSKDERHLDDSGPYRAAVSQAHDSVKVIRGKLRLSGDVRLRHSRGLEVPGFKGVAPPRHYPLDPDRERAFASYWLDPEKNAACVPSPLGEPASCVRYERTLGDGRVVSERAFERDGYAELNDQLRTGLDVSVLEKDLCEAQLLLARRLINAGMIEVSA